MILICKKEMAPAAVTIECLVKYSALHLCLQPSRLSIWMLVYQYFALNQIQYNSSVDASRLMLKEIITLYMIVTKPF